MSRGGFHFFRYLLAEGRGALPGWAENRKIAAMMANVTHSITARTSVSLLFCSGIPVPPRSIVPSCTIHMAYLKSIPVLRCRIKRKKTHPHGLYDVIFILSFTLLFLLLLAAKPQKRAAALTDCGPYILLYAVRLLNQYMPPMSPPAGLPVPGAPAGQRPSFRWSEP